MSNNRKDMERHRKLIEQERERDARREADMAQLDAIDRHCDTLECMLDGVKSAGEKQSDKQNFH